MFNVVTFSCHFYCSLYIFIFQSTRTVPCLLFYLLLLTVPVIIASPLFYFGSLPLYSSAHGRESNSADNKIKMRVNTKRPPAKCHNDTLPSGLCYEKRFSGTLRPSSVYAICFDFQKVILKHDYREQNRTEQNRTEQNRI